ncbi:hypothetical protein AB0J21_03870 [Streptomyces sp. NPDC049954]|uniref:hypothetical protein n=1 Tax=Streptomyces sp. NPDC049954 TaxID=3155779 RepID=UPI0034428CC3
MTGTFGDGGTAPLPHCSSATSGNNDNLGPDAGNPYVTRDTAIPGGARSATLSWRVSTAGDNGYRAVDHLRADGFPLPRN